MVSFRLALDTQCLNVLEQARFRSYFSKTHFVMVLLSTTNFSMKRDSALVLTVHHRGGFIE